MARDVQRKRLFQAEMVAERRLAREEAKGQPDGRSRPPVNTRFADEEIQDFVDAVTVELGAPACAVRFVPDGATAEYVRSESTIVLPPWARNRLTVLHEVAHHLTHELFPSHGAEFAAAEIALLEKFVAPPAARYFEEAFAAHGVKTSPSRVPVIRFFAHCRRQGGGRVCVVTKYPHEVVGEFRGVDKQSQTVSVGDTVLPIGDIRYATWA